VGCEVLELQWRW